MAQTQTAQAPNSRDQFNRIMKEVDLLIKQAKFRDAALRLNEAREIEPGNPYVKAFEERLHAIERNPKLAKQPAASSAHTVTQTAPPPPAPGPKFEPTVPTAHPKPEHAAADREAIEAKLREEIELHYRERYTQEIRAAEHKASHFLEQEQEKIKKQRDLLKAHYEESLAEMQQRLEGDFRNKLDGEVRLAEERLRKEFEAEQTFFENEMKKTLASHYEGKLQLLEERLEKQQTDLMRQEQESYLEKDRLMKEQYNRRLLEELRKAESAIYQQSEMQQKVAEETLKERLTREFDEKLKKEEELLAKEFEARQESIQSSIRGEKEALQKDYERQLAERIEEARKREAQGYEEKRAAFVRQLEGEHKKRHEEQLDAERTRMRKENESALEAEREKLRLEREQMIAQEAETIRNTRRELRVEMDKLLVERLEQLRSEYDRKIDLLGIAIPKTQKERLSFYRERLRSAYTEGEPSSEQALDIFELKELLELSYDDHVRMDSEVRLEQYVQALEKGLMAGRLDLRDTTTLDHLKTRFHILPEEAAQVEAIMVSKMKQHLYKGTVLLADDEDDIRMPLAETIEGEGYFVIPCSSVPQALKKLETERIDLIVSDIKFAPGEPDGFKFFQAVQKMPEAKNIPFVLLSSLTDDVIVRSGIQLGVDDYLTKPVDPEMLIAVIQGKLKRRNT